MKIWISQDQNLSNYFLPDEMHSAMVSGIGIAMIPDLGTDSSLVNASILQFLFEHVRK